MSSFIEHLGPALAQCARRTPRNACGRRSSRRPREVCRASRRPCRPSSPRRLPGSRGRPRSGPRRSETRTPASGDLPSRWLDLAAGRRWSFRGGVPAWPARQASDADMRGMAPGEVMATDARSARRLVLGKATLLVLLAAATRTGIIASGLHGSLVGQGAARSSIYSSGAVGSRHSRWSRTERNGRRRQDKLSPGASKPATYGRFKTSHIS